MFLSRIDNVLDTRQLYAVRGTTRILPRLQGGREPGKCEYCAWLFLAVGVPVWVLHFDLSKAFYRVNWIQLWHALTAHVVSRHLVWIIQCLNWKQSGCVQSGSGESHAFAIRAGVRQRCVRSPGLFNSQLSCNGPRINREKIWKQQVGVGTKNEYGLPNLLHLRFAEDILLFGRSADKIIFMFDSLMGALAEVDLILKPWGKHNLDKRNSTCNPPSEHWEFRT